MNGKPAAFAVLALTIVGCAPEAPRSVATIPKATPPVVAPPVAPKPLAPVVSRVALLEPYLVPVSAPRPMAPAPLGGRILPETPIAPVVPTPPAQPLPNLPKPSAPSAPSTPKRTTTVPPAIVRLFQDERARSVEDARRRLAAAAARAAQSSAEAKKQWGFVRDGFVAQKQAENADAAARDAASEQADAQKTLDEAQQRQRDAKRDLESALRAVAETPSPFALALAQLTRPSPIYQPVPGTYRLSVLGVGPVGVSVQNGTAVRRLPSEPGEAGAWLVRCPDPSRLRVGVDAHPATLVVRSLPEASAPSTI